MSDYAKDPLVRLALAMMCEGHRCKYCDHQYTSVDDLIEREIVRADGEEFSIACKACYDKKEDH
jgi:hypothetical protein